jgi:dihydropteroate synthase
LIIPLGSMKTDSFAPAAFPPLVCGPYTLPVGARTLIMGIVNVTPDSFSGDGLGDDVAAAVAQAQQMAAAGADLLDVGGLSTRPGAAPIAVDEEIERVVPVIRRLAAAVPLPISVDTYRAPVAEAALLAGAHLVNDITGFREDPALLAVAARHGAPVIAMHIKGRPATMQQHPTYTDLLGEVIAYLRESVALAAAAGIPPERVWVDPGIGFGKTFAHNLELLHRLGELRGLGCPILVGTSRKAFIGQLVGGKPHAERVYGTAATLAISIWNGASVLRVHDVGPAVDVARVADAIVRAGQISL